MQHVYFASLFLLRPAGEGYELLLGLRSPAKKYMGGTWQLISGRIEAGETAWQAALRETCEETGLQVQELYRLPSLATFYRPDNDTLNTAIPFCGFVPASSEPRLNPEHIEFKWLNLADAESKLMWPADRASLRELKAEILSNGPAKPYLRIPF